MENIGNIILGIMIVCGDDTWSCVRIFYEEGNPSECGKRPSGFASGVMVAASVWSLLIPSMNLSADLGRLAFLPAVDRILLRHPVPAVP